MNNTVDITKLRYFFIHESGEIKCTPVSGEMKSAMTRVVKHFTDICDTPCQKAELPGIEYTSKMWRYWYDIFFVVNAFNYFIPFFYNKG